MNYKPYHVPAHLYFVTATIVNWLSIFNNKCYSEVIIQSFEWHRFNNRMKLFAFVIMPNHLHWISLPIEPYTINDNIKSFSSYTAHKILHTARNHNHQLFINTFSKAAKIGKKHKIWLSFQAKNIYSFHFLTQKLEYIHNNPLVGEFLESSNRSEYRLSTACYYDDGIEPIIQVDDIRDFLIGL